MQHTFLVVCSSPFLSCLATSSHRCCCLHPQVDFGEFEVTLFKQHVRELVKRQVNRQRTPQRTLLRDKIAFVLGSMGAM